MDRAQVLEKLEPIRNTTVRPVVHTPRTRVLIQPGQVVIRPGSGGQLVPLSENGIKAMTNFVGLPRAICRELSPDLFGKPASWRWRGAGLRRISRDKEPACGEGAVHN